MNMNAMKMTTKEFVGAELEKAWADFSGGVVIGGLGDRGRDVATKNSDIPTFQVKGHPALAEKFLLVSMKKREFIPIVVGEPPRYTKETRESEWTKVRNIIRQFGGYVALDIPRRESFMGGIRRVRTLCGT